MTTADGSYPFQPTELEFQRLRKQSEFFHDSTTSFLRWAGIQGKMRVLDVGCGIGGVTKVIASLLARGSQITALDQSKLSLEMARTELRGVPCKVSFHLGRIFEDPLPRGPFDAIVGRMVLMYSQQPVDWISVLKKRLVRGGFMAFQEPDHSDYLRTRPTSQLYGQWRRRVIGTVQKCGARTNAGPTLAEHFRLAGLCRVAEHLSFRVDGGTESTVYEVLAGTVRSLAASMQNHGFLASSQEVPQDLAQQFRDEAVKHKLSVFSSRLIGVVGRRR